jgi:hypothetical protein
MRTLVVRTSFDGLFPNLYWFVYSLIEFLIIEHFSLQDSESQDTSSQQKGSAIFWNSIREPKYHCQKPLGSLKRSQVMPCKWRKHPLEPDHLSWHIRWSKYQSGDWWAACLKACLSQHLCQCGMPSCLSAYRMSASWKPRGGRYHNQYLNPDRFQEFLLPIAHHLEFRHLWNHLLDTVEQSVFPRNVHELNNENKHCQSRPISVYFHDLRDLKSS